MKKVQMLCAIAACVGCLGACSDEEATDGDDTAVTVAVSFQTVLGSTEFGCGDTYQGVGSTGTQFTPTDLRMYVHDVTLLGADGAQSPILLDQDGKWQYENVALLDFEDGCGEGAADMNTVVRGAAEGGPWSGIRFGVGVPFDLNHGDAAAAAAPLDNTAMFWSWNQGYKHIRLDASTTGLPDNGYHIHMGSAGCQGDGMGNVTECTADNRPQVELTGFDPTAGPVVFDLTALLAQTDVDVNTERTAPGCFGDPADPDCTGILANFGLSGGQQVAFRAP